MEEDDQPADGWRLLDALWHLQSELHFQVFAASAKSGHDVDHGRSVAWRGLIERINRGEVVIRARRLGKEPQVIPPDMLDDAQPDYAANRLTCCGETFYSVRLALADDAHGQPYRTGVAGRPTSRALVLEEMRRHHSVGVMQGTLAAEARELSAWLSVNHSSAPQMSPKSVEDAIRAEHRLLNTRKSSAPG